MATVMTPLNEQAYQHLQNLIMDNQFSYHEIYSETKLAKELGISKDGYRLIFNTGAKAGQSVFHMHAHLLGGEEMGWPEA